MREQKTKTKDTLSEKLSDGMQKIDKPSSSPKWTKDSGKKKRRKRGK